MDTILTAVSGSVATGVLTKTELCDRLGINWRKSRNHASTYATELAQCGDDISAQKEKMNEISSIPERKKRSDYTDRSICEDFWHLHTRLDTFNPNCVITVDFDGTPRVCCPKVQKEPTLILYAKFQEWPEYKSYCWEHRDSSDNPANICLSIFKEGKCACIKQYTLGANAYMHHKCLEYVLKKFNYLPIKNIRIMSDGCACQYWGRRTLFAEWKLAQHYNKEIVHVVAPTATFKTVVDGAGRNAKHFHRTMEKLEMDETRATNAYELCNVLRKKMPQPKPHKKTASELLTFTSRHHILVTEENDSLPLPEEG